MTRLIQIGDCHMKPGPRSEDRWWALDRIITDAIAEGPIGAWLLPGDLNDARMSIEDRNYWVQRAQRMAAVAPVYVCYGNHDLAGDLDFLERLRADYPIRVFATPTTLKIPLANYGAAVMFVLPYPTKAGLVALGVAPANVVDEATKALEFIFMSAAADLRAARERGEPTFMIGHINVGGSVVSTGQPQIGHEIELNPVLLDMLGPCYKGLNHIHKAQAIAGAHYAGSICRLSWGEIEEKRYLDIALEDDGSYLVRSKPIGVAPMYHVDGTLTKEGFGWAVTKGPGGLPVNPTDYPLVPCEVCHGHGDIQHPVRGTLGCPSCAGQGKLLSWANTEVRVRYTFYQHERAELDEKAVSALFKGAKRLELEPIAVRTHDVRAPEVVAAVTLPGKIVAWGKTAGIVVSAGALEKLGELEIADHDTVLARLRLRLAEQPEEEAIGAH